MCHWRQVPLTHGARRMDYFSLACYNAKKCDQMSQTEGDESGCHQRKGRYEVLGV